ncbi:two-partner secretion domain-containing protein [Shewanella mangrovisoli]|uniref:two-partner secretion domain-containing protein n=1 Tax=Shewanella mangrovisoli TaxID=2864211 RepID=UPI0035B80471
MRITNFKFFCFTLLALNVFYAGMAFGAVSVLAGSGEARFISQEASNFDTLIIDKPAGGISYNEFSMFSISSKKLVIFNSFTDSVAPANTIIIKSKNISIANEIEIIGAPANIILLSPSVLTCAGCSFNNAGRVTFASASIDSKQLVHSSGVVGKLSAIGSGRIQVSNLISPGVQSLEFIADNISVVGTVDINMRADVHPEGGYVIHPNGGKVVGSGGINFYPGKMVIDYENLRIDSADVVPENFLLSAKVRAASIAIISPKNIKIAPTADLSTISDVISTSTLNEQFYAPIEGIFVQSVGKKSSQNSLSNIVAEGKLSSDNKVLIKSINRLDLNASVVSDNLSLISGEDSYIAGYVQSTLTEVAARNIFNSGRLSSKIIRAEAEGNIFNSYGGDIKAGEVVLKSNNGNVINGSRSDKRVFSREVKFLPIIPDITSLKLGVFYDVNESGVLATDLSANISANNIFIQAKAFENINPYSIVKSSSDDWTAGISIKNKLSNQVSVRAENKIEIKASNYVLNSSGIIGVNQTGKFIINSPKLSNERYRMQMENYVYNQMTMSGDKGRQFDSAGVGTVAKIIAYSPPARIYSFGEFLFSDGSANDSERESFVNELSYFEIFNDAHFHQTEIKTIGLEISENYDYTNLHGIRDCLMFRTCDGDNVTTLAEAETLFSVNGSIYGVDKDVASQADLVVANINVRKSKEIEAINKYLAPFFYKNNDYEYGTVKHSEVQGDILSGVRTQCKMEVFKGWGVNRQYSNCKNNNFQVSINWLLSEEAKDRELGATGYTPSQLEAASKAYVASLPIQPVTWTDSQRKAFTRVSSLLSYSSYSIDGCFAIIGYKQLNTFYGYNHAPYTNVITESYSVRIPIEVLMKSAAGSPGKAVCSSNNTDNKHYTEKQYSDAAKKYVSTLPIDSNLWSANFKQVRDGKVKGTTSNTISFISYSLSDNDVLVSYKQTEQYTVTVQYAGTRSFSESHDLTKRVSVAELMNYLPR